MAATALERDAATLAAAVREGAAGPDADFLARLLCSADLRSLLKLHAAAEAQGVAGMKPVCANATDSARTLMKRLIDSPDAEERALLAFLADPAVTAVLRAHDELAGQEVIRRGNSFLFTNSIVVRLDISGLPLGVTLRSDGQPRRVFISRIAAGSAADKSGVCVGDELLEVNDTLVAGESANAVADLLARQADAVTLRVRRGEVAGKTTFFKALVDYSPTEESWIPCIREGLALAKGDIIKVGDVSRDWLWATVVDTDRSGLIPGPAMQERVYNTSDPDRKRKLSARSVNHHGMSLAGTPTLEEVVLSAPHEGHYRPLVLIGPVGVGRNTIKTKLLHEHPDILAAAIPHTTRAPLKGEQHGREYFFVSRERMEADIKAMRMVEHGEYQGALYSTSFQTIRDASARGMVCIVDVLPKALKALRIPSIQPFVVFIKPPSLRRLHETRPQMSDEQVQRLVNGAAKYESTYSYLFDQTLINDDLEATVESVFHIAQQLRTAPQWIPASWADTVPGRD